MASSQSGLLNPPVQAVLPRPLVLEPIGQAVLQLTAPVASLYTLAGQGVQLVAPVELEYVPASHSLQLDEPSRLLYLPAGQRLHTACGPPADSCPAGQIVHARSLGCRRP
jgi:hypothetical protein